MSLETDLANYYHSLTLSECYSSLNNPKIGSFEEDILIQVIKAKKQK